MQWYAIGSIQKYVAKQAIHATITISLKVTCCNLRVPRRCRLRDTVVVLIRESGEQSTIVSSFSVRRRELIKPFIASVVMLFKNNTKLYEIVTLAWFVRPIANHVSLLCGGLIK